MAPLPQPQQSTGSQDDSFSADKEREKDPKLCFCIEPATNLTEAERRKKNRFRLPFAVLSGIASLVLLVLAIVALIKIQDFTGAYNDIVDTWEQQPIYDVAFAATPSSCPSGYSWQGAEWTGTYDACQCTGAYASNSTDTRACTSALLSPPANCQTRTGYAPVQLNIAPTLQLCLLRAGVTALTRTPLGADGTCPSGSIACGTDSANAFCEPNNVLVGGTPVCPLTDLYIGADAVTTGTNVTKTSLGLVDGTAKYLFTVREGSIPDSIASLASRSPSSLPVTNMPLTSIDLVHGEPCLITSTCYYSGRSAEYAAEESTAKASNNGRGYILQDGSCSGCRTPPSVSGGSVSPDGVDIRYINSGLARTEKAIFTEAGVPSVFVTSSNSYTYSLQVRSEVLWVNTCQKTRDDIVRQRGFVHNIESFQVVLLVVAVFSFLIFSLAIPIVEYRTNGHWTDKRSNWYFKTLLNVFFKIFVIAFTVATMVISLKVLVYWTKVDGSTPEAKCTDLLSTEVFKILSDDYRSLSYSNIGSSIAMGASGAADAIGHLIFSCFK